MTTQVQHFYAADRRVNDCNEAFLFLVRNGMTREELERNIQRRPALWERFSGWLEKLPSHSAPAATSASGVAP